MASIKFCEGDLVIHKITKTLGKIVPKVIPEQSPPSFGADLVWVSWGKDISSDAPHFNKAKLTRTALLEVVKL